MSIDQSRKEGVNKKFENTSSRRATKIYTQAILRQKKNIIFAPVVFLSLITFSTTVAKQLAIDRALSFRQQQQ